MTLKLETAREILRATLARGRELSLKPLSVVVLDPGGHVMAFEREDGASPGRFDIARGKAYGAIMLGIGGRAQMERAEVQSYFVNAMNGLFDGKFVPVPGGLLVRDSDGTIIGSVGVTGDSSDNDTRAGEAGIAAAGFQAEA